jgi:hypothetical protein
LNYRSRPIAILLGTLAVAACSPDGSNPVAPSPSSARSVATASSANGRYILASNSGFASDLTTQVEKLGGTLERVHAGAGIAVVTGITTANASKLGSISGVSEVEPDMQVSLSMPVASAADASAVVSDVATSQGNPTLAGRYAWQWNMRLIGADKAWAAGKLGSSSVTAAILDTGIDYDAPDLNGLVDLSRSTSFVPSDDAITAARYPSRNVISDYHGHGTNVATQVSSKALALAGVTSRTTLIGVKVLDGQGNGDLSWILNGVLWAADHGANVANMSLGGAFAKAGNGRYVGLINKVFNYAAQKGMLVVVAAGNDATDFDHDGNSLPTFCAMTQVVCVSAVGPATGADFATSGANAVAAYTNFGRSAISVAGPGGNADFAHGLAPSAWPWGVDIASWVWSYCSKTRLVFDANGNVLGDTACRAGNRLTGYIGTSQATPHVAGLAALLMAEHGIGQPSQIKAAIEKSAVDLGQPGTDPFYGKGRISVSNALGL